MTNSNQKERFQTKIAMLEQNNQVLLNKCDEYLGKLDRTRKALKLAVEELEDLANTEILADEWVWMKQEQAKEALKAIKALEQKDVK